MSARASTIIRYMHYHKSVIYFQIIKILASILLCVILFDLYIGFLLSFPKLAKYGPLHFLQYVYADHFRTIIQYEPAFAQYDPELKYTFIPGTFIFQNLEYTTKYSINSIGIRDNEASLTKPEIIVIGDSVPMGWGVQQHETFAKRIENETNIKVLNAAISSYSPVQAIRILDKIDTSNMKYLIFYYEHWKFSETHRYYTQRENFTTLDESTYQHLVRTYQMQKKYYFGKYFYLAIRQLIHGVISKIHLPILPKQPQPEKPPSMSQEATELLYTILHAGQTSLSTTHIIIVTEKDFIESLRSTVTKEYPDRVNRFTFIGEPDISNNYAYILDDHPNAEWHKKVAHILVNIITDISSTSATIKKQ